jgi:hypothetical protein
MRKERTMDIDKLKEVIKLGDQDDVLCVCLVILL